MAARLLLVIACVLALPAAAQQVELSKGVSAAGLLCFPRYGKPNEYVYLPQRVRLATHEDGSPQFSLVRYAIPSLGGGKGDATIQQAGGGGILHFLVVMDTDPEQVERAQNELRQRLRNHEIKLMGPIVFKKGRYVLVSSVLRQGETEEKPLVLATGRAPVLEGNQLALSFGLTPEQSTLLMTSLQMATPDVSLQFELTFSGLTEAFEARLVVDWTEAQKSMNTAAGGSIFFVGVDVEVQIDELRRTNAIKLETVGDHKESEAMISKVYNIVVEMLFRPIEPEEVPQEEQPGLMDVLADLTNPKDGALSARKLTGFGAYATYKRKEIYRSGKSVIELNHREAVDRHHLIAFNIGDLYKRWGDNENHFRTVNLEDPIYRSRVVEVGVDATLLPEFGKFVNSVVVTLRKQHSNGDETVREVVLDKDRLGKPGEGPRMAYGWADQNFADWLRFDVRERWSFLGGGKLETDWRVVDTPMIDVIPPFERREVQVLADPEALRAEGVRSVVVRVSYPFFGETKSERVVIRTDRPAADLAFQLTQPRGEYGYDYEVMWLFRDGKRTVSKGHDDTGLIFADVIPEATLLELKPVELTPPETAAPDQPTGG